MQGHIRYLNYPMRHKDTSPRDLNSIVIDILLQFANDIKKHGPITSIDMEKDNEFIRGKITHEMAA
jgi:hypothetical protein